MSRHSSSFTQIPNPLPAAFLRGGTSKGIFINRKHLPPTRSDWSPIFSRIMGSPDPEYGRQLNGMGGGISSLSKIMVVGPPSSDEGPLERVDAEYTFAQVGIRDTEIDYSGNCGNLSSMVGAFAVDEGICTPRINPSAISGNSLGTVRMWNTNTNKEIHTTFPVTPDSKPALDLEQISIAGVPGKASQILLDFVDPCGARTGKLLPTGNSVDHLSISHNGTSAKYPVSLVDATNPTIFIAAEDLFASPFLPNDEVYTRADSQALLDNIECIRKAGAVAMGLDPSLQAQPKIAILGLPSDFRDSSTPRGGPPTDICIQAMSMGVLHRAVPMTVGLCLGVAATISGTIPHHIIGVARTHNSSAMVPGISQQGLVRIRHPSGTVDVGAESGQDGNIKSAKVVRTGRHLMQGAVWW